MSESKQRCDDCVAHSGVATKLSTHAVILTRFDDRFNELNKMLVKILLGTLLCFMAASLSAITSVYIVTQTRVDSLMEKRLDTPHVSYRNLLHTVAENKEYKIWP